MRNIDVDLWKSMIDVEQYIHLLFILETTDFRTRDTILLKIIEDKAHYVTTIPTIQFYY